jgi:C4-dicarboxylate transporter DctM subunit
MLLGVPVAFCLGFMATLYVGAFGDAPFLVGTSQTYNGINILTLVAIPLLILSGKLMHEAGVARCIVDFAQVLVGRVRGGLGAANVVASFLFGDISGSAVSDTAAIGSLMIPQMKARGYRADFCAALQGTAGTLGMMAPLAITILLYASATGTSVSRLAAATIMPAFLMTGSFILVALLHARRYNYPREYVPRETIVPRTLNALPGMFAIVLVLAGVLGGVCTPAEVGSIVVVYVLLLSHFLYHTARPRQLYAAVVEAGYISSMSLFMAGTSYFLGFVMARDVVDKQVVEFVTGISTNKYVVILIVSIVFIVLGMVLEPPAMIFGFLPSFLPLLATARIDIVYWGVLFCTNMGLGCIIPPVAMNLFVSTQIAGVRYEQAVRATVPFIIIMMIDLAIMAVFPQIPLLLPHLLFDYPMP